MTKRVCHKMSIEKKSVEERGKPLRVTQLRNKIIHIAHTALNGTVVGRIIMGGNNECINLQSNINHLNECMTWTTIKNACLG